MRSSGIEDILSQAEICLPGTAKKIMTRKDCYLMVRAHTLVGTAMFELLLASARRMVTSRVC